MTEKGTIYLGIALTMLMGFACTEEDTAPKSEPRELKIPDKITLIEEEKTKEPSIGSFILVDSIPHDNSAFTQGLSLREGKLIETTGLIGMSKIKIIDAATGKVDNYVNLPLGIFGEGNTLIDDTLYVITYKNQVMYKYSYPSLDMISETSYYGEGWGLDSYQDELVMSNGTSTLFFRNPTTFETTRTMSVTRSGISIHYINELEVVDSQIYANIWGEDVIVLINGQNGAVERIWDMSTLRYGQEDNKAAEVLNGLAYDSKRNRFYLTGKNWNQIYIVELE